MTTQTPALPFPVTPRRPREPEADLTGFTLIHRALRSGTRDLAVAASAIGAGAPCPAARREAYVAFATEVLHEIHLHHTRDGEGQGGGPGGHGGRLRPTTCERLTDHCLGFAACVR
jgi:hypothetical protein